MCGIAGIVAPDAARFGEAIGRAIDTLIHRGPDGAGIHAFDGCILGHRRLAIVDLEGGSQPMLTRDGKTAITFNGAIYGFREIRRSLEHEIELHTTSDTEVILALYRKHGFAMLDHLPGMFAFAIWDERTRTLFAARDRFGEKPFFWARGRSGELIFASEIRAILATGLVARADLDRASLANVLHSRYVPVDRTIWSNIHTLPPAHSLTFRDERVEIARYWDLPAQADPLSVDEAIAEFRRLFERSVEKQLVADVPVASFLSGGLDSSSVVAVASGFRPGIRTISVGFSDESELHYARQIARRYRTDHLEIHDKDFDVPEMLMRMSEIFDQPHPDIANGPTWMVCRLARREAKVILTGEGGDELLGGYPFRYRPLEGMNNWMSRPRFLRVMASIAERAVNRFGIRQNVSGRRWLNGATHSRRFKTIARAHRSQFAAFDEVRLARLGLKLPPSTKEKWPGSLDEALRDDVTNLLPGHWLVRLDRASMACGIELRSPFLDVDFASFCVSLPPRLKIHGSEDKWILRRAFGDAWTRSIRRRTKKGFNPSIDAWVERPELAPLKSRILDDPKHRLYELVPFSPAREMAPGSARRTWILLNLGLWAEKWMT